MNAEDSLQEGLRQAEQYKTAGNGCFGQKQYRQAYDFYTKGIEGALQAQVEGKVNLMQLERRLPTLALSFRKTLAALHANRAAAALELKEPSLVLWDACVAICTMTVSGTSCNAEAVLVNDTFRQLHCKARVRRATTLEAIGNFSAALADVICIKRDEAHVANMPWSIQDWGLRLEHRLSQQASMQDVASQAHPPYQDGGQWELIRPAWTHAVKFNFGMGWAHHTVVEHQGYIWCYGGVDCREAMRVLEMARMEVPPLRSQVVRIKVTDKPPYASCSMMTKVEFSVDLPPPHAWHSDVVYKGAMYIWGGIANDVRMDPNDCSTLLDSWASVWRLPLNANSPVAEWKKVQAKGNPPPAPLRGHTAVVHKDTMYVFGGTRLHEAISTDLLWKFNLKSMKWDLEHGGGGVRRLGPEDSATVPEARHGHAAWVYQDWMYIFGGMQTRNVPNWPAGQARSPIKRGMLGDMWRYHILRKEWEEVIFHGNPPGPRACMGCAALRDGCVWLLGGCIDRFPGDTVMDWYEAETNVIHCADVFEFDSAASRWMQVVPTDSSASWLSARLGASAAVTQSGMLVTVGGYAHPAHRPISEGVSFASCLLLKSQQLTGPVNGMPALPADEVQRNIDRGKGKSPDQPAAKSRGATATASNGSHGPSLGVSQSSNEAYSASNKQNKLAAAASLLMVNDLGSYGDTAEAYYPEAFYDTKHKYGPLAVHLKPTDMYEVLGGVYWAYKLFKVKPSKSSTLSQLALIRLHQVVKVFGTARAAGQYLSSTAEMHSLVVQQAYPGAQPVCIVREEEIDPSASLQCEDLKATQLYQTKEGETHIVLQMAAGRAYIKLTAVFQHTADFITKAPRFADPLARNTAPKAFLAQQAQPIADICSFAATLLRRMQGHEDRISLMCGGPNCNKYEALALTQKANLVKVCRGCKLVRFCSAGCQKKAWKEHEAMCLARCVLPLRPERLLDHMRVMPSGWNQGFTTWPPLPFHQCYPDLPARLRRLKNLREAAEADLPRSVNAKDYILVVIDTGESFSVQLRKHSLLVPEHYNMDRLSDDVRQLQLLTDPIKEIRVSNIKLPFSCTVKAAMQLQQASDGNEPCLYITAHEQSAIAFAQAAQA